MDELLRLLSVYGQLILYPLASVTLTFLAVSGPNWRHQHSTPLHLALALYFLGSEAFLVYTFVITQTVGVGGNIFGFFNIPILTAVIIYGFLTVSRSERAHWLAFITPTRPGVSPAGMNDSRPTSGGSK